MADRRMNASTQESRDASGPDESAIANAAEGASKRIDERNNQRMGEFINEGFSRGIN